MGIIKELSTIQFQLLSPQGDTINATINTVAKSSEKTWKYAPLFKNLLAYSKNSNYWYSYDEKSKTLYFNYQRCREDENEPFKKFNAKLFKTIEEVNPNKIILSIF